MHFFNKSRIKTLELNKLQLCFFMCFTTENPLITQRFIGFREKKEADKGI